MSTIRIAFLVSLLVAACGKKADDKPGNPSGKPSASPPAQLVEHDLSPFGEAWKGYVAMAPAGTKIVFDDPSRQITVSDTDYIAVSEAPYFEDGVKSLAGDADNKNVQNISPGEVRYERNPPIGKQWCFDYLVKLGESKWSCNAQTFTSAAMADQLLAVCKSIRKK